MLFGKHFCGPEQKIYEDCWLGGECMLIKLGTKEMGELLDFTT